MTVTSWLFPFEVTISVPGVAADDYGTPVPFGAQTVLVAGDMQPVRADETVDGVTDVDVIEVEFYLPAGTAVGAGDRLTCGGDTFEAIGEAQPRGYGGRLDVVKIRGRRTSSGPTDIDGGDVVQVFVDDLDGGEP